MAERHRPSRQQQLTHAAEATKARIASEQRKLAAIESAQRAAAKQARDKRRYQVGTLADTCGLLVWDDAVLRPLFTLVATVTSAPNPVALLEGLLQGVSGQPGRSVHGFAHAAHDVSSLG